ncbi:Mu-like prophage FluMu protein gp28-like protein [uncultured Alphaproteobacteria bacterium]|uniref:Mu-like prophage FluMu protein gp28-like protein n=1 Tax=uncultured Alphaproteobacteria bacterium TaxID=91750 RepID=A0A212KK10_9PROT|nr:Mu-like prophage FluMu protein gp28-like protein [uncultured Alphaproteobacteria bacterium]
MAGDAVDDVVILSDSRVSEREEKQAYELVEDIQQTRETRDLKAEDVPAILLPYQVRWHEDMTPIRVGKKSRRIGFSWGALAAESVLEAMPAHGGMDQHYMGYNQGMSAEYIGDCAFFAGAFGAAIRERSVWRTCLLINNERLDVLRYKIQFANGRKIEAHSSNPHNWRGRKGHARVDEAAFHKNLKEVLKGAMAFLMWGGRVDVVSTMNGEDNDFTEICREIEAGQLPRYSLHQVTFKDALGDGFYGRVCLIQGKTWTRSAEHEYEKEVRGSYLTAEDAAEELDCVAKRGSGAYFTRLLIENCQEKDVPILRLRKPAEFVVAPDRIEKVREWILQELKPLVDGMPTDRRTVLGQDFGRNGDLSVIWILQQVHPTLWRTPFLLELRNIPFDCQWLILEWLLDELPLFHHGKLDARGNGQSHAEKAVQKLGEQKIEAVMASAGWYADQFPRYRQAYEGTNILVPVSEDVIADHRLVVLHNGNPTMADTRIKGSDGLPRHGDTAIAGLLAWAATREEVAPPAGESINNTPRRQSPGLPSLRASLGRPGAIFHRR